LKVATNYALDELINFLRDNMFLCNFLVLMDIAFDSDL